MVRQEMAIEQLQGNMENRKGGARLKSRVVAHAVAAAALGSLRPADPCELSVSLG